MKAGEDRECQACGAVVRCLEVSCLDCNGTGWHSMGTYHGPPCEACVGTGRRLHYVETMERHQFKRLDNGTLIAAGVGVSEHDPEFCPVMGGYDEPSQAAMS